MAFPSPAENYQDASLDLNSLLVQNPSSTFFIRNESEDINHIQIGDILIVDRALSAQHNTIVVAVINDTFMLRRLIKNNDNWTLKSDVGKQTEIRLDKSQTWEIWGVVKHYIHSF